MQSSAALHRNAFYSSAVQQTVTQLWEQAKFPYQKTNYNGAQFWSSKTFFFPKQWATILPGLMIHKAWSTELLPLESNLWKTQTHIPFGQFQTEKKKLKNGYRHLFQATVYSKARFVLGERFKEMQAVPSEQHCTGRWMSARIQLCRFPVVHLPLSAEAIAKSAFTI